MPCSFHFLMMDLTELGMFSDLEMFCIYPLTYTFQLPFHRNAWSVLLSSWCNCSQEYRSKVTGTFQTQVSLYYNHLRQIQCTQVIYVSLIVDY